MDTAPDVAALPSDPQSNGVSNVDEIVALIGAVSLSPEDVQRLTTAVYRHVAGGPSESGDIDSEDDGGSTSGEETSSQVPAPIVTTAASLPTPATPPAPAPAARPIANQPTAAPVVADELAAAAPVARVANEPAVRVQAADALPARPVAPAIPAEHFTTSRSGVLFLLPLQNVPGPYYLITKGRSIGVVADWSRASPLVIGVKGAVFHKVPSVSLGLQSMLSSINDGTVEYL